MNKVSMYANFIGYLIFGKPLLKFYEFIKAQFLKYRMAYLIRHYGSLEATPNSKFPTVTTSGLGDIVFHNAMSEMAKVTGVDLATHPVGKVIWRCLNYKFKTPQELKEAIDLLRARNINEAVYYHFVDYRVVDRQLGCWKGQEWHAEFSNWIEGKTLKMFSDPDFYNTDVIPTQEIKE